MSISQGLIGILESLSTGFASGLLQIVLADALLLLGLGGFELVVVSDRRSVLDIATWLLRGNKRSNVLPAWW